MPYHGPRTAPMCLTHLPLVKMAVISQTIVSDAFLWMKMFVFWLKFHWSVFLRGQLKKNSIGLDKDLAPNRRQAFIWTNGDPTHWRDTRGKWVKSCLHDRWYTRITPFDRPFCNLPILTLMETQVSTSTKHRLCRQNAKQWHLIAI